MDFSSWPLKPVSSLELDRGSLPATEPSSSTLCPRRAGCRKSRMARTSLTPEAAVCLRGEAGVDSAERARSPLLAEGAASWVASSTPGKALVLQLPPVELPAPCLWGGGVPFFSLFALLLSRFRTLSGLWPESLGPGSPGLTEPRLVLAFTGCPAAAGGSLVASSLDAGSSSLASLPGSVPWPEGFLASLGTCSPFPHVLLPCLLRRTAFGPWLPLWGGCEGQLPGQSLAGQDFQAVWPSVQLGRCRSLAAHPASVSLSAFPLGADGGCRSGLG